jgi:hypothetical protein
MTRTAYFVPSDIAEELIHDALKLGSNIRCDQLDASKSWFREKTAKTPEEILQMVKKRKDGLFHFILRQRIPGRVDYFDVGCSTLAHRPDYFLWIDITPEQGAELIAKYGLELLA